jgi:hypothetical protein
MKLSKESVPVSKRGAIKPQEGEGRFVDSDVPDSRFLSSANPVTKPGLTLSAFSPVTG